MRSTWTRAARKRFNNSHRGGARIRRLLFESLEDRLLLAVALANLPDWIGQGPGPIIDGSGPVNALLPSDDNEVSGAMETIAPHPTNSNVIYVGTVNGGVFKTSNAYADHQQWTALTDQFPSLSIGDLKFSPLDFSYNTLFAGFGKYSSSGFDGGIGSGLLRTTDGGTNWTSLGVTTFQGLNIRSVVPTSISTTGSPAQQVILVAAQADSDRVKNGGIYRSADGGVTWNRISGTPGTADTLDNDGDGTVNQAGELNLPLGAASHLVPDPSNPQRFYAAIPAKGVFRSDDGGVNWQVMNNGIAGGVAATTRIELSVHFKAGGTPSHVLYAGLIAGGSISGLFYSLDQGANWNSMTLPADSAGGLHPGGQGGKHFSLLADRNDPHVVYLGGDSVQFGDTDQDGRFHARIFSGNWADVAGNQWTRIAGEDLVDHSEDDESPHPDSRDMQFDASGAILESDDGGIYRHRLIERVIFDDEFVWESVNGNIQVTEVLSAVYDSNHNTITIGSQDNGSATQDDEYALEWEAVGGGDGGYVATETRSDGLGTYNATYFVSQNFENFRVRRIRDGAPDSTKTLELKVIGTSGTIYDLEGQTSATKTLPFTTPFVLNSVTTNQLLIGTTRLYESITSGDNLANLGFPNDLATNGRDDDGDGVVDDSAAQDVNGDGDMVDTGEAAGETTKSPVSGLAYGGVKGSCVDPGVVWVAAGNVLKVRRSITFDADCNVVSTSSTLDEVRFTGDGNPNLAVIDLAVDGNDWDTVYLLLSSGQVLRSTNASEATVSWTDLTDNLPAFTSDLRTIVVDSHSPALGDEIIFVGGQRGVYRYLAPNRTGGTRPWTEYGRNLPNALVQDLYYAINDDLLLAGTKGRSAWTMEDVRDTAFEPSVLVINGFDTDDVIRLQLDPNNPLLLQAFLNDPIPKLVVPAATISAIRVDGLGGNDTLTVDLTNGNLVGNATTPYKFVIFNGGEESGPFGDRLEVLGGGGIGTYTPSSTALGEGVVTAGGMKIEFTELEPVRISDFAQFAFITPNVQDVLTVDLFGVGSSGGRIVGSSGGVRFEELQFFNGGKLTIDTGANDGAAGGDDVITFANAGVTNVFNTDIILKMGPQVVQDLVIFEANGLDVTHTKTTIQAANRRLITFTELERINLNGADDVIVNGDFDGMLNLENSLTVNATGLTAGDLRISVVNQADFSTVVGPMVVFNTLTSLRFNANGEDSQWLINEPVGAILAPRGGMHYEGSSFFADNNWLLLRGGGAAAYQQVYSVGPGYENGTIQFTGPASTRLTFVGIDQYSDTVQVGLLQVKARDESNRSQVNDSPVLPGFGRVSIDERFVSPLGFEFFRPYIPIDYQNKENVDNITGLSLADLRDRIVVNMANRPPMLKSFSLFGGREEDELQVFAFPAGVALNLHGDEGNDRIWIVPGLNISASAYGGAGRDSIILRGGADFVDGGEGVDYIEGGDGNDVLQGGLGADRIRGGLGNDIIRGLRDVAGEGETSGIDEPEGDLLFGEDGDDQLFGSNGADVLDGGDGIDTLNGGGGNDVLLAGSGIGDSLYGGAGDDRLYGSDDGPDADLDFNDAVPWGDLLDGGPGDDVIEGLGGADRILGGEGKDQINSGTGSDWIQGGPGDDVLYAGLGLGDRIDGDSGNDTVHGSHEGDDTLNGGDGDDALFGQGGNDALNGDAGDDHLDGGANTDTLLGEAGNDVLVGGGGVGDLLNGGDQDDVLHGSDDGADDIRGGPGRDRLFGLGGNDRLSGDSGDDILEGGAGDDLLLGDLGNDLLVGGADHDTLHGHTTGPVGDDNGVDYLYGDFGANQDQAASGRDRLFGEGGNDALFGEGNDDFLDAGGGANRIVDFGSGEGANATDFVSPAATPPPIIVTSLGITQAGSTLPVGEDYRGRWVEFAGSATRGGLSNSPGIGLEPSVLVDLTGGRYVAWVDSRNGNDEIYVAHHTTNRGWQMLAGSAEEGGVSRTAGSSRRPALALANDGTPIVAWTEFSTTGSDIRVAKFEPNGNAGSGLWVSMGASLASGGINGTTAADFASIVNLASGPVVAWIDSSGGAGNVYARQFAGGIWSALGGDAFASGTGVSASARSIRDLTLATDGTKIAVGWAQPIGDSHEIYAREFQGGTWRTLAGSNFGGGISNTVGDSRQPSLAYFAGQLFAAWQDDSSEFREVYAATFNGGTWQSAGSGANSGAGVSSTNGQARFPRLASGGGSLFLGWADDTLENRVGDTVNLYARRWNGTSFQAEFAQDSAVHGITATGDLNSLALSVSPTGQPYLAWTDFASGRPQVYLRGNTFAPTGIVHTANATQSVQSILDNHDLNGGDVILIAGNVGGFTIGAGDSGVTLLSLPGVRIDGPVVIDKAADVTLQGLALSDGVTATQVTRLTIRESSILGRVVVDGGSDAQLGRLVMGGGLTLQGGTQRPLVQHNQISGSTGLSVAGAGASDLVIRANTIRSETGISLVTPASGRIENNDVEATANGLMILAPFTGLIHSNEIHGAMVGVSYLAPAALSANRIHNNITGVRSRIAGNVEGLGFVDTTLPNEIFANMTGVDLVGQMQLQHVYANTIGVRGSGQLIVNDLDHANLIENNITGVEFAGPIQFQRIAGNQTGIVAKSRQLIAHNLIYRNTIAGVLIAGQSDVRLFHNTFYTPAGDHIRITNHSANVELRNNILWTESGYDIYVGDDSQTGFFSDFNNLQANSAGKLVGFSGHDFTDVLDWQVDVARFDLHSIGSTVVSPGWSTPPLADRGQDDYRLLAPSAGLRLSAPATEAGDPLSDQGLPTFYRNLLANPDFETGVANWTTNPEAATRTASPNPFEGANYFAGGTTPVGFANQTINLTASGFSEAQLDGQNLVALFGGRIRSAEEAVRDRGQLTLEFLNVQGDILQTTTIAAENLVERWELIGDRLAIPVGTRQTRFRFDSARTSGPTADSFLDHAFVYVVPETTAPDQGAYGNTPSDLVTETIPRLALRYPDLYIDWERDKPQTIRWDSYGNVAHLNVRVDLYRDTSAGPERVANLATSAPDTGEFTWIPASHGVNYGTYGLRVQISLAGNAAVFDTATESFNVPEDSTTFFVNDRIALGDQLTTALGSNRNTGRTSSAPKPYPNNVLRTYTLGAGHSLQVDSGEYRLLAPIVLSGAGGRSDDEGFSLLGPVGAQPQPILRPANPLLNLPVIELDDADFVSLSNLRLVGGQYGLWAHNGSTNLTASHLAAEQNSVDGFRVESTSPDISLDHLTALSNARYGVWITGPLVMLANSESAFNRDGGVLLQRTGPVQVLANSIHDNRGSGLVLDNDAPGQAVIGNENLGEGRGNMIRDNAGMGIDVRGNALVVGNTVSGHSTALKAGIFLTNQPARLNVVFDNYDGIIGGSRVSNNRVYHNSHSGIVARQGGPIEQNLVYDNVTGIHVTIAPVRVTNNLVYGNTNDGVWVQGTQGSALVNNTLYQLAGNAVRLDAGASNVELANNIVVVESGTALHVATDSQNGFMSDFNLLTAGAAGAIGIWQGGVRKTLNEWRSAASSDRTSLSQDPLFVNRLGADGRMGYLNGTSDGRDDDFHVQSSFGSYHGGALAPVLNLATGQPIMLSATLTNDTGFSPAIDRGRAGDAFGNEPSPNGQFINLGADGNSPLASRSPSQYTANLAPNGGEVWPAGQKFAVLWRSHDAAGEVKIELLDASTQAVEQTIAASTPNSGSFNWSIPADQTPKNYLIRVTRLDLSNISDTSNLAFTVPAPVSAYYVNDSSVSPGDWTNAIGNDANDGLSPATPKASVRALLEAYDLGPGDTVRVDAGDYNLTTNLVITPNDSGIKLEGYHDLANPTRQAVLRRGNTLSGSWVIEIAGADDVTLDHLGISGGEYGVILNTNVDSDRVVISNSDIFANRRFGIWIGSGNELASIVGNSIHNNTLDGLSMEGAGGATISDNRVFEQAIGTGIVLNSNSSVGATTVRNNEVFGNELGINAGGSVPFSIVGNHVHNNRLTGIRMTNAGQITENDIHHNGDYGIFVSGGTATRNQVYDNANGILLGSATASENRVYHNANIGIFASSGAIVQHNVIYNNSEGIQSLGSQLVANNVIYDNTARGIHVRSSGTGNLFQNNTIDQPFGDAVFVDFAARNVQLRNNILSVSSGYAINVAPDSEIGFSSDYNNLQFSGGKLARWEGRDFTNLADWTYELGFDQHSQTVSPQFLDVDGLDNVRGFVERGLLATYFSNPDLDGLPITARVEPEINSSFASNGLIGVPTANFSVRFEGYLFVPQDGSYTLFSQADDGERIYLDEQIIVDQWAPDGGIENSFSGNLTTGWHSIRYEMHQSTGLAGAVLRWSGPGISKQIVPNQNLSTVAADVTRGDYGEDDDFHVPPNSPTIDSGDPASATTGEPTPNGGRANIGSFGNSAGAATSSSQLVQVLSPNGREKLEHGQIVDITWRTAGLSQPAPYSALVLADAPAGYWQLDESSGLVATDASGNNRSGTYVNGVVLGATGAINGSAGTAVALDGTNDLITVPDSVGIKPSKLSVEAWVRPDVSSTGFRMALMKTSNSSWSDGYGLGQFNDNNIRFFINGYNANSVSAPIPKGQYSHVVGTYDGASIRLYVNGELVRSTSYTAPINHSAQPLLIGAGQGGFSWLGVLDEVAVFDRALNGTQIQDHFLSQSSGTVDIDLLQGDAITPSLTIAGNVPNHGQFAWRIPTSLPDANDYRIQVRSRLSIQPLDPSDAPFLVTNGGTDYYVNDQSIVGDFFTTAIGDNTNSGKSPAEPLADLSALLAAYDLGPGDVIHVDTGNYRALKNVLVSSDDSGVRIEGPPSARAVIDRGNTVAGSYVIQLSGADDVTIDHLALTGGEYGIFANAESDADRLTITANEIYGNRRYGVFSGIQNDNGLIAGNQIQNNLEGGAHVEFAAGWTIRDNVIDTNTIPVGGTGITALGVRGAAIHGNRVFGHLYGITARGSGLGPGTTISDNHLHHNLSGIAATNDVLVVDNEVSGAHGYHFSLGYGLSINNGAVGRNNVLYDNDRGIDLGIATVTDNRVYYNRDVGIQASGSGVAQGNLVYANGLGFLGTTFSGTVRNNLFYDNPGGGFYFSGGSGARIETNTIVQSSGGDAIQLGGTKPGFLFTISPVINLTIRNNVFVVPQAYVFRIDPDSEVGLLSDYNAFNLAGNGKIARWEGRDFATREDWFFEVGLDQQSLIGDPQFIDPDGPDDIPGFATGGLRGSYFANEDLSGEPSLTRTDAVINFDWSILGCCFNPPPAPGLPEDHFSVRWDGFVFIESAGDYTFYTTTNDGERLYLDGTKVIDQWTWDGGLENSFEAKAMSAGWHPIRYEMHDNVGSAVAMLKWSRPGAGKGPIQSQFLSPDPMMLVPGDYGRDDNFRVATTSPTIDAGDPLSLFLAENVPNGGRVNLGHTGNSSAAAFSREEAVHVLSPNGLEKLETGQSTTITWQSAGMLLAQTVGLIDVGGQANGGWASDQYAQADYFANSFSEPLNLNSVQSPAPAEVYRSYRTATNKDRLAYELPVPAGDYTIRLHFAEFNYTGPGRRFDIRLNGTTVKAAYDVAADAGGRFKAAVQQFDVVVSGNRGILLELVNVNDVAILSGIELLRSNPMGDLTGSADVQISMDNGARWTTVGRSVPLDVYGKGRLDWTIGAETEGNTALVRVISNHGSLASDTSNNPFLISNAGHNYYVNDNSLVGDSLTTATGDNFASGKQPNQPMKTLRALLAAYDLDPLDVIHVDAGDYRLFQDILLAPQDSGVRITGPSSATALFNRGNQFNSRYVVQLAGADDVTLDRLSLAGASGGVYALSSADSDALTISNSDIFGNRLHGVFLDTGNTDARLIGNKIHNNSGHVDSAGIYLNAALRTVVSGNDVFGNNLGIYVIGSTAAPLRATVSENSVHDNTRVGIEARDQVLVSRNTVFGHLDASAQGILVVTAEASDNVIYGNSIGLATHTQVPSPVLRNRVFQNDIGIDAGGSSTVHDNQVYSNTVGIRGRSFRGQIANNLLYANSNQGIYLLGAADGVKLIGNTIYQAVGDAVRGEQGTRNLRLADNVLWVEAGYDLSLAADSQFGFTSDYNLFHQGIDPNAHVGLFAAVVRDSLSDWQAATAQDAHSLAANPALIDINGSDNVLGYSTTGAGFDGGRDDNFHLLSGSPAIDRGEGTLALNLDREGYPRRDDPGTPNLGAAGSVADLGAHEFQSSSLDVTPPTVVGSQVRILGSAGNYRSEIHVVFSEPIDAIDGNAVANYDFREAGTDRLFDTPDDVTFALTPRYISGSTESVVDIGLSGGFLPQGNYRFIVRGSTSIHDLAGLNLDGDLNGTPGGDSVGINQPPALDEISTQSVIEGSRLDITIRATDADAGQTLSFALDASVPEGAALDPVSGLFTWTPLESAGPGTFVITVFVSDNGSPRLVDLTSFTIEVAEANNAPVLISVGNKSVDEGKLLTFTALATDSDMPGETLRFSLDQGAPDTASIDPTTGVFRWRPGETRGPGAFPITIRVTDSASPPLTSAETIMITVHEINEPPAFLLTGGQFVVAGNEVRFQVAAFDNDTPSKPITYSLTGNPPAGATIDEATGEFVWQSSRSHRLQKFPITIRATDTGSPPEAAETTVVVSVGPPPNSAPQLASIGNKVTSLGRALMFDARAIDADLPFDTLTYSLGADAPLGATIDSATGDFAWTPGLANGKGNYLVTIQTTDNGSPALSAIESITIKVSSAWHNPLNALDVSPDGVIAPNDALEVINEINGRMFSQATTGSLPLLPLEMDPPPYVDVNDDGFAAPIDTLLVINFINEFGSGPARLAGEGELFVSVNRDVRSSSRLNEPGKGESGQMQRAALLAIVNELEREGRRSQSNHVASGRTMHYHSNQPDMLPPNTLRPNILRPNTLRPEAVDRQSGSSRMGYQRFAPASPATSRSLENEVVDRVFDLQSADEDGLCEYHTPS